MRTEVRLLARLADFCVALTYSAMSKPKEVCIKADKIVYVHYSRESSESPSPIVKASIDFYSDGKKQRLVVRCNKDQT